MIAHYLTTSDLNVCHPLVYNTTVQKMIVSKNSVQSLVATSSEECVVTYYSLLQTMKM
jgi:hypothetical protein